MKKKIRDLAIVFVLGAVASVGWQVGQLTFSFWMAWIIYHITAF